MPVCDPWAALPGRNMAQLPTGGKFYANFDGCDLAAQIAKFSPR
jgi:hypothetical protein